MVFYCLPLFHLVPLYFHCVPTFSPHCAFPLSCLLACMHACMHVDVDILLTCLSRLDTTRARSVTTSPSAARARRPRRIEVRAPRKAESGRSSPCHRVAQSCAGPEISTDCIPCWDNQKAGRDRIRRDTQLQKTLDPLLSKPGRWRRGWWYTRSAPAARPGLTSSTPGEGPPQLRMGNINHATWSQERAGRKTARQKRLRRPSRYINYARPSQSPGPYTGNS